MNYIINNRNIHIPDEEIFKNMKILKISKEQAIQMYLEDEGYVINETVVELTKKAKENKVLKGAKAEKARKPRSKERKPDEEKEKIIKIVAAALENEGIPAQITNISKIIEFSIENNHYKLDLIKKRVKKS